MAHHLTERIIKRATARRALGALVLCVGALALAAGPAAATPDGEQGFGYNIQSLVRPTLSGAPAAFPPEQWPTYLGLMASDGIRVARADALWRPAEQDAPVNGVHTYDWSTTDQIAAGLARQGIRWDVVATGSPRWAMAGFSQFSSPKPEFFGDFAAFAGALAARYGAGGAFWAEHPELPAVPVTQIEIWNEPNTEVHWGVAPNAADYAALYAAARAAIKAANPGIGVSVGGIVWNDDVAYLNAFFGALGPDVPVDGLGSHPYAPTVFALAANVVRVRKALDDLGRAGVPLEINELGWPAAYAGGPLAPKTHALDGPVTDQARAATMSLAIDGLSRSTCDVSDLVVYDLVESELDALHVETFMGLFRHDGSPTVTGTAFADSVARYRAELGKPGLPVPACGARGATATRVLPLGLQANPASGGCAAVTVTYLGQPLEEAQVRLLSPGHSTRSTDANGQVLVCRPPRSSATKPLRISADVPGMAASNVMLCGPQACTSIGPGAACATTNAVVTGSKKLAAVLKRGILLQTAGCNPQIGAPARVRAALTVTKAAAKRAGIAAKTKLVTVGKGSALVAPGQSVTLTAKFTKKARRALAAGKRLNLTVQITAKEDRTVDATTRRVTLTR